MTLLSTWIYRIITKNKINENSIPTAILIDVLVITVFIFLNIVEA